MIYQTFLNFIERLEGQFRKTSGNFDKLIDTPIFQEFVYWYQVAKATKPNINKCGVCLYEHYHTLKNMKAERLLVTHIPKEGKIVWHGGRPYSRQSEHLTQEIVDAILKETPGLMEVNQFLPKDAPNLMAIISPEPPVLEPLIQEEAIPDHPAIKPVQHHKKRRK